MKTLSSLETHYLVKELKNLEGSKVDKIYQREKTEILFQLHKPGKGKQLLKILVGKAVFLASSKEASGNPGGFSMLLRKHLSGTTLRSLTQLEPERILHFTFQAKNEEYLLYVELFGKGNVILCSKNNVILDALFHHQFKDRTIKPKEEYAHPSLPNNLFEIDEVGLSIIFKESKRDSLVITLAADLGLGGIFAEELCLSADVNKNTPTKEISKEILLTIEKNLVVLLHHKLKPIVYSQDGKVADVFPFPLFTFKKNNSKTFPSFSAALEHYYAHFVEKTRTKYDGDMEKLLNIIKQQESNMGKLEKQEMENKDKAELIYSHYQLITEILSELKKAEQKHNWHDIKKKLKGHNTIKEVNPKEKTILLDIQP